METINEQDVIISVRETYQPNRSIDTISEEEAMYHGRKLQNIGLTVLRGMFVRNGEDFTVERAIHELDHTERYKTSLASEDSRYVVGPRYEVLPKKEFCPSGVAIWGPKSVEQDV